MTALCADVARGAGVPVLPGFLEMTEPSIPQALEASVARGATRVVVLPYFLHPGMHVRRDLVAIVDAARAAHPNVTFDIAEFLGADPGITAILVAMARASIA